MPASKMPTVAPTNGSTAKIPALIMVNLRSSIRYVGNQVRKKYNAEVLANLPMQIAQICR
ncbi:hypothetical protein D3C78_1446000 [compost metagenome]